MTELDTTIHPGEHLTGLRQAIDAIDEQIIALWAQRNGLAAEIGAIKRDAGGTVYSHQRDLEVRERWAQLCQDSGIRRDLGREAVGIIMKTSYEAQRSTPA